MGAVTRRDLARALKEEHGGTIAGHDRWIQAFIDILSTQISERERVEIRGFGAFNLNSIKAHTTVVPSEKPKKGKKRKKLRVPKTYTVDFKPSKAYKERLKKDQTKKKRAETRKKKATK